MNSLKRHAGWFLVTLFLCTSSFGQTLPESAWNRLHPDFQELVRQTVQPEKLAKAAVSNRFVTIQSGAGETLYGAIVYTASPNIVARRVKKAQTIASSFFTAYLHLDEILQLARDEQVRYIDPGNRNYPVLDVSVPETGAAMLHSGFLNNTPYRGKGAIILIYDTGIDWKHLDFRDPEDTTKTRILYIWDQTLSRITGEKPPAGFSRGVEYTKAHIEDELDGSPEGFVRTKDINGHGTHVAGIAAGNGLALESKYVGMAPEADIIVVKGGDEHFDELLIIEGLRYAQAKAQELGRPIVVNLSLGGQQGPHDGTRAYETYIDEFSRDPGRVVIVAAGNDGDAAIHIGGTLPQGEAMIIKFTVPEYQPESGKGNDVFGFDLWFDGKQTVSAEVRSPSGIVVQVESGQPTGTSSDKRDGHIQLSNTISGLNGLRNIRLRVSDEGLQAKAPASGEWVLVLSNVSNTAQYDGWLYDRKLGGKIVTIANGDTQKTVSMPGTAQKAITVASYVSKWSWPASNGKNYTYSRTIDRTATISSFSSIGPTRDGRQKPEIAAPGQGIAAALSTDSKQSESRIQPGGHYFITQGTSMATPHVAGAVALLLAEFPDMKADEIKSLLIETVYRDSWTGNTPNPTWGYGKLDILHAMVKAKTGQGGVLRKTYAYDSKGQNYIVYLTGELKYAIRFTPEFSGRVTALKMNLSTQQVRPIVGSGPLLVGIYRSTGGSLHGVPGEQIGVTVEHDFSRLSSGIYNYIDLIPANATVEAGKDYHVVVSVANPTDTLVIRTDREPAGAGRSSVFRAGQWYNFDDPLSGIDINNNGSLRMQVEVTNLGAPTLVDSPIAPPAKFTLEQNYPNPFNPETLIGYTIPREAEVRITIYNLLGQKVLTLVEGRRKAGSYRVAWNGKDERGHDVPSGLYIYRLESGEITLSKKMLLVR